MAGKGLSVRRKSKKDNTSSHRYSVVELVNLIIEQADVILEVLDSRFIEKTRNEELEEKIKKLGKKIIFVLNKSDLVDKEVIEKEIELHHLKPFVFVSSKTKSGAGTLKEAIMNVSLKVGGDVVNVGVVGYPNVGKSSVINLLTGRGAAKTSSVSGFTKGLQKVKITSDVYLIDTPGIIPVSEKEEVFHKDLIKHAELGVRTWDNVKEPEMMVHYLLQNYPGVIEEHYSISAGGNSEVLIEKLGSKLNYLKKGGVIDSDKTARKILRDWQEGKICF